MNQMNAFARLIKVDEARREVTGILAEEVPDKSGEIFDYKSSKPHFQKWNEQFAKATDGQSVGNLREMHGSSAAGKFTSMEYDDDSRRITVTAKVVDGNAWKKVVEGVYTGFSIGGRYAKTWQDPDDDNLTRYTGIPVEGSLVDNPCMYGATFTAVKADGATEVRKFAGGEMEKKGKTKRVAGVDLSPSSFAYVGDPEKTDTWKLPIDFPDDEQKTKRHIRNALARFSATEGIPESEKPKVKARILRAAKKHGIDAKAEAEKVIQIAGERMQKGLCTVGQLADLVQQLAWIQDSTEWEREQEGDESEVPDMLGVEIDHLSDILLSMAEEETDELKRGRKAGKEATKMADTNTDGLTKRAKAAEHLKKAKAAHEKMRKHLDAADEAHDEMAEHLDNLHEALADGDDDTKKAGSAEGLEKRGSAPTDAEKSLQSQINDLTVAVSSIAEAFAKMAGAPAPTPVAANAAAVVTKAADSGSGGQSTAKADDPLSLIKTAQQHPSRS